MGPLTGPDREAARVILDSIGAPITIGDMHPDGEIRIFVVNRAAVAFYGVPADQMEGRSLTQMGLRPAGRAEGIKRRYLKCIEAGAPLQFRDFAPVDTAHGRRWVHTTMAPLSDPGSAASRVMATIIDVTDLKIAEDTVADAFAKVLSGFIPICAACKKIRNKDESWQPVEEYIGTRSSARFSHSMCPTCSTEWYGPPGED